MSAPRYILEQTGGIDGTQRALADVSLDIDALEDRVENAPYSAAVSADWSGSPPTTIKQALDRIAATLGPIP